MTDRYGKTNKQANKFESAERSDLLMDAVGKLERAHGGCLGTERR